MIAEFTVENFRSFKEKRTFSLIATKDKELSETNTFHADKKLRFLRSAVIYGANASGKSNFFNALIFFLKFSVFSGPRKQVDDPIETEPFALSRQTENAPSKFEIIFITKDEPQPSSKSEGSPLDNGETRYRYGLAVGKTQVENEYLYAINNVREVLLFERQLQDINYTQNFKEGARGKKSVRSNCSFLSICAQNNGEISRQIIIYFRKIGVLSGLYDSTEYSLRDMKQKDYKEKIINFLKYADIQITDYKTELIPDYLHMPDTTMAALLKDKFPNAQHERILYGHTVYDNESPIGKTYFDEAVESTGTRKLFSYSFYILTSLKKGWPLFIDEFDTMLHPLIIEGIVKLYNSPITNPKNAQLVISCHAVNIMTNKHFRRDQIWFCEKDQYSATDFYSLVEYDEKVRKDASYNKNYLQGKYGAIPYINDIML